MRYTDKILIISLLIMFSPLVMGWAATYYVDAVNGDDANPGSSEKPWRSLSKASVESGRTYYIPIHDIPEGSLVLLREGAYGIFGEDSHSNYYEPPQRSEWTTYKAESGAKVIFDGIRLITTANDPQGSHSIIIDSIEVNGSIGIEYTNNVQILNCILTTKAEVYDGFYAPYYLENTSCISGRSAYNITIENNDISACFRGITPAGDTWTIRNNHFHDLSDDAIMGAPNNLVIDGNHIHDSNGEQTNTHIFGVKQGDFIEGEKIIQQGTGAEGIVYMFIDSSGGYLSVWQTTEAGFKIASDGGGTVVGQDNGATMSSVTQIDGAHVDGIHIESEVVENIIIINNTVYNTGAQGISLYGHGGMQNVTIVNNLVYNITKTFVISGVNGVDMYNNTTFNGYVRFECTAAHPFTSIINNMFNNIFSQLNNEGNAGNGYIHVKNHGNNIFGNNPDNTGTVYTFEINDTELVDYDVDSQFIDVAGLDFYLKEDSIAIGFGDPLYAPSTDLDGNYRDAHPDAGCYEYGASKPEPDPDPQPEPDPELEEEVQSDDTANNMSDKTLLRISNNIIKSGGNSVVTINCDVKEAGKLTVKIYDSKGREIITLWNKHEEQGTVPITWLGEDNSNNKVGSGIYMVHMKIGNYSETKKIAVIK